jgi:hypothetical protein
MGEVRWADTDNPERDITCGSCETKWKSPVKVIDGKTILEKPCPKCGWNYTTNFTIEDK